MKVYHGSNQIVDEPLAEYNSGYIDRDENLDFGSGFYLTTDEDKAYEWASAHSQNEGGTPTINIYDLDDDYKYDNGYFEFEDTDYNWFVFLKHCRSGEEDYEPQYTIVEGKVADDQGYDIFESVDNGNISEDYAIEQLSDMELGDQICLRTQNAIDLYLKFITSEDC